MSREIIHAILSNNAKARSRALRQIHKNCYHKIRTFVINTKGTERDAEDTFQEGMLIFYDNVVAGKFKGEAKCETYIYSICRNIWIRNLRKTQKIDDILLNMQLDAEEERPKTINLPLFNGVFKELKEECQKLLIAFYYEQKSLREIKEEWGFKSEQVVKNKKGRCLTYLMKVVEKNRLNKDSFFNE